MRTFACIIAIGIFPVIAAAQTTTSAPPAAQAAPTMDDVKPTAAAEKICVDQESGSTRFTRRVCHTQEEWDKLRGKK